MGYHTTINQRTAMRRAYKIQDVLPPGMGTIYAWDWAYVLSGAQGQKNVKLNDKSIRFSYIGLANQITTSKRIGQHITDSKSKDERGLYIALGNALNDGESTFKSSKASLTKSGNGVVEIIHVASLFDLGNLETHLIEKENTSYEYRGNTFSDIINDKGLRGQKFGLNTAAGGQGDPLSEGTTTSVNEWILAAYAYFIEDDSEVIASRKDDDSLFLLTKNNNDYGAAITELIEKRVPGVDTDSTIYQRTLNKVVSQVTGKEFKFLKGKDGSIDFGKTFEGSYSLQTAFSYEIGGVRIKIDTQVAKKIVLKKILEQDTIDASPPAVQKILSDIKNEINKVKTTPLIKEGLEKAENVKEKFIRNKGGEKITDAYVNEITSFMKNEIVFTAKGKNPNKDVVSGLVYGKIEDMLKTKYPKMFLKNKQIFSDRAYLHEASQMKETGGFLTPDSVAKILSILLNYVEVYYSVVGSAPSAKEIGQILGESTKEAFGDQRVLEQLTKK